MKKKNLKIGIIGSHGVGKTTLVNELSNMLEIPKISEVARKYKINSKDRRPLYSVQRLIMTNQIYAESLYESFISDRTTIDNCAYFLRNTEHTLEEKLEYVNACIEHSETYTHIFYIPIEFGIETDGFRSTDIISQDEIDELIRNICNVYGIKTYTLYGTVENRIDWVMNILNNWREDEGE